MDSLSQKCNELLIDYNNLFTSNRMDLVLFMNAI